MAIDSAAKRRGVSSVACPWMPVGITPDASPDQAWRQTSGWGWYGILVRLPPSTLFAKFPVDHYAFASYGTDALSFARRKKDALAFQTIGTDPLKLPKGGRT